MTSTHPTTIDEYIAAFPPDTQIVLNQIRAIIQKTAPEAEESISYGMPTFKYQGKPLVYFGAFKNHIGLYALPTGNEAFKEEFARYKTGKGSVQFPLDEPMPLALITRVIEFRVRETSGRSALKNK